MTSPFKTSLLLAALVACSSGYAQSTMTRDQAKAEHDRIEAMAKADKKACDAMEGNAEDVCEAEAKAKEKVAKAELRYQQPWPAAYAGFRAAEACVQRLRVRSQFG